MSAYKIRSHGDFVPKFPSVQTRRVVQLAAGEEGRFVPFASPARSMQAAIEARMTAQTGAQPDAAWLTPLSRLVICVSLAIAAWVPPAALALYLLG